MQSFAIALSVLCGRYVSAARFAAAFAILVAVELAVVPVFGGFLGGLVMFVAVLVRKILPVLSVGLLIIATTEVSEFLAVAAKLRVPRAVTVPLSVDPPHPHSVPHIRALLPQRGEVAEDDREGHGHGPGNPELRGNREKLAHLRLLASTTCVGLRYG